MFQPDTEYDVLPTSIDVKDFHEYPQLFVTRPPYQRKNVWSSKKQQSLLDSLFRRYYIPRLVLREVRIGPTEVLREVVDGQQRITTVQRFFAGELRLPESLGDLDSTLPGCRYRELPGNLRQFVDKGLKFDADLIKRIDNPKSPNHQKIATEIFWRLQQGESLNFMEIAHARLSSLVRNFLVKYADDITFDFAKYQPIDENKCKHQFFDIIDRNNDRMQHLSLLGRLLLIERGDGPTDVRDKILGDWIDETQEPDGIGNLKFEADPIPANLLRTLNVCRDIFRDDPTLDEENGVKELNIEYFIISVVMLVRHLRKYYALQERPSYFARFIIAFHQRWKAHLEEDRDILGVLDNRQQSAGQTWRTATGSCAKPFLNSCNKKIFSCWHWTQSGRSTRQNAFGFTGHRMASVSMRLEARDCPERGARDTGGTRPTTSSRGLKEAAPKTGTARSFAPPTTRQRAGVDGPTRWPEPQA